MTAEERYAMESINRHFTFRERTAFLCGYRLGKKAELAEERERLGRDMARHIYRDSAGARKPWPPSA